jgi:two-component system sensor histidine kinase CiaH
MTRSPAVLRLTLSYLAILMVLSLFFSYLLYHFSNNQLSDELRQPTAYEWLEPDFVRNFERFRESRLNEAQRQLINNLITINLGTLIFGSFLSYGLAKRNIHPIEKALEAQSRFTADASHELRTPLTTLQTEIEVSLRDKKLSIKDAKQQLESNLEEVIKLRDLSDRLLKLARNEKDIKLIKTSYQKAASDAIETVEALAVAKNIILDNQTQDLKVIANPEHLQDVIVILLDNAIKYSPANSTVTITARRKGNYGLLDVVDHGQGIKATDLPRIFDRFYRADDSRSKDRVSGYGLGLSIAYKLLTYQRGTVEAKSTVKKGSTFTVKLPLVH